jgi:hypothetical protein
VSERVTRPPALIVDGWTDVQRERLEGLLQELPRKTFDHSGLFRETWMRRIHGLPPGAPLELTYAGCRWLMTRTTGQKRRPKA